MKRFVYVVAVMVLIAGAASAQDRVEVFGGYSYEHLQNSGSVTNLNLNGWNAALTFKHHWYGVTADFSGLYGTPTVATIAINEHQHNFLFGPHVSAHLWKVDPFAHALFGVSRQRQESGTAASTRTDSAIAAGGGIDIGVWRHLAVRIGQADWMRTNFGNSSQDNFRFSAGLVARF
jgi:peptidoglycan-associated lipoprotein